MPFVSHAACFVSFKVALMKQEDLYDEPPLEALWNPAKPEHIDNIALLYRRFKAI